MRACTEIAASLLMLMIGGCTAGKQISMPLVTPQEGAQVSSYLTAENQPSCKDQAWAFNPENDVPDVEDECSWELFATANRWAIQVRDHGRVKDELATVGYFQEYAHRYEPVVCVVFHPFFSHEPAFMAWYPTESNGAHAWTALRDEQGAWHRLGWIAPLNADLVLNKSLGTIQSMIFRFTALDGTLLQRVFDNPDAFLGQATLKK